jgi:MoaA/NifB/PqqE/SkfB family radical SAM enzyme
MKQTSDLKNYICSVPFNSMEIHNNTHFLCCPSWLPVKVIADDRNLKEIWNDNEFVKVRESVLDGSYKYCNKELCPHLNKLIKFGKPMGPISNRKDIKVLPPIVDKTPENIIFNFDRSCNYKCPSCRVDLIVAGTDEIKRIKKTIDEIDEFYSENARYLYITGSGDPFVSTTFRNYLRNFNPEKYPNLMGIHLHTNASMWTKEMWDSMPNIHKYVKSCEISIDAGTKDTYENKTRIGGEWEVLIDNLKFITTIPTLTSIKTSFVVQDSNYMEMEEFYNIMYGIFGSRVSVFFGKITNWGTFSEGEYMMKKIWDKSHPEHDKFLSELNKVWKNKNLFHNMYELINIKKTLL